MIPLSLALLGQLMQPNDPAPALVQGAWIGNEKPISLRDLKGSVTVLHFWTFACSNCAANMPRYNEWFDDFSAKGVKFIGIHTPEIQSEYNLANVKKAIARYKVKYPVLVDNDYKNWKAWNQQFWPTVYLIDKKGHVRYRWEGELEYNGAGGDRTMRKRLAQLLAEN